MRQINEAVVHCTATRADFMAGHKTKAKVEEIRRWHKAKGWRDIGYHYLIDRDGTVVAGRPVSQTGAHVRGRNTGTIGVALFGGHGSSENDAFEENFTPEQDRALRDLLNGLKEKHGFTAVSGHNQFAAKACPGFRVSRWLAAKTPARTSPAQSKTVLATAGQAVGAGGAGITALAALDGTAQLVALGFIGLTLLLAVFIFRERIRKWAAGDR